MVEAETDGSSAPDAATNRINFSWLLWLRTGEIAGQLAAACFVDYGLQTPLPMAPIFGIAAAEIATNVTAAFWLRRAKVVRESALWLLLALDVLLFSVMLGQTGGPYNPFSFLYLVQIAMGAVVLSPAASVGIALLCFAANGALFAWHVWLPMGGSPVDGHELHHLRSHVEGMWVALVVASALIIYFVQRVRRSLAERERELAAASSLAQRNEKLAAVATLSAGAAHELSTPLSTIAVAARELERELADGRASAGSQEDVRLIRGQVDRCRGILEAMAAHAGEGSAEAPERVAATEIMRLATVDLGVLPIVRVESPARPAPELWVPPGVLSQALKGIVRNAQQAAPAASTVRLGARRERATWVFEVEDQGTGMSPQIAARAGEPFFTTKPPGEGMGLGLFLARATAEQLGGRMEIESWPGRGTRVRLIVPCDVAAAPEVGPS